MYAVLSLAPDRVEYVSAIDDLEAAKEAAWVFAEDQDDDVLVIVVPVVFEVAGRK